MSFLKTIQFGFLKRDLSLGHRAHRLSQAGGPSSSRDLSISIAPVLGLQALYRALLFVWWGPNSGPQARVVSIVLTEPSPQP